MLGPFSPQQVKQAFKAIRRRHTRETAQLGGLIRAQKPYAWSGRGVGGPVMEADWLDSAKQGKFLFPPGRLTRMNAQGMHVRAADVNLTSKVYQRVPGEATFGTHWLRRIMYPKAAPHDAYGMNMQRMRQQASKVYSPRSGFIGASFPVDRSLPTAGRYGLRARLMRYMQQPQVGTLKSRKKS